MREELLPVHQLPCLRRRPLTVFPAAACAWPRAAHWGGLGSAASPVGCPVKQSWRCVKGRASAHVGCMRMRADSAAGARGHRVRRRVGCAGAGRAGRSARAVPGEPALPAGALRARRCAAAQEVRRRHSSAQRCRGRLGLTAAVCMPAACRLRCAAAAACMQATL